MSEEEIDLDKLSEEISKVFKDKIDNAKGCSIEGCVEPVTGFGDGKPYCQGHFWEEFDKRYPD